jgi:hypothetical protein
VLACAEAVNVLPSGLARDERHFVWRHADCIAVSFVQSSDPADNGAVTHVQDVGEATGSCEEWARHVFERMEEDIVYKSVDDIECCPCNVRRGCQNGSVAIYRLGVMLLTYESEEESGGKGNALEAEELELRKCTW